jgi:hypothetical protein
MFAKIGKGRALAVIAAFSLCAAVTQAASPANASEPEAVIHPDITQAVVVNASDLIEPTTVSRLSDGTTAVTFGDTTYISSYDRVSQTVAVATTDGSIQRITIDASLAARDVPSPSAAPGITPMASISGVSCTMALWFLGVVASAGWEVAVGAALAMGAVGAAVVALAMSLGTTGLMAWAGTHC